MENLQNMLARFNGSPSETPQASQNGKHYHQPTVSSPVNSPTPTGLQPRHPADILSPNPSAMNTPLNDMAASLNTPPDLLGLLRLRQQSSYQSSSPSVVTPGRGEASSSLTNPQDVLLKLLNQSKPPAQLFSPKLPPQAPVDAPAPDPGPSIPTDEPMASPPATSDPATSIIEEYAASFLAPPVPGPHTAPSRGVFTAINPFEQLSAASPLGKMRASTPVNLPERPKESVKETVEEPGEDVESAKSNASSVAADWEDEPVADEKEERFATIYSMPMRPFVSITVQKFDESPTTIPDSQLTHIARMRKEFDQVDRTLVASTSRFIVYALIKSGLRLIRQDSGKFKQLYENCGERIFNLSISRSKGAPEKPEVETVLGTGVKGTVFWAPLTNFASPSSASSSTVLSPAVDERGFIFPPVATPEEQTSSGQLKTRVKASSKSPEFFAYGRGKNIHIIYPLLARSSAYTDAKTKICDSEKFLRDDDLKISTGKAAKDFAFSADDTVIASLDKAGKLKFWDVRPLTKPEFKTELRAGVVAEVKTPVMTLNTTLPSEKSWPTSVIFLDRERPMNKGLALRYMIIGQKQNHTIQLWDLSLSKPVQEINFPHGDESDAICSLAYNQRSGILTVGHPTRNSIYLLHVSLPQYNLGAMNQAKFISLVAEKSRNLPAPASTVIFSSVREYSLGSRGSLRSMDLMLDNPTTSADDPTLLMTLICMHSKGIFEFAVSHKTMGWGKDDQVVQTDALKTNAVSLEELRQPIQDDTPSNVDQKASPYSKSDTSSRPATDVAIQPEPSNGSKRDHESDKIKLTPATAPVEKEKKPKKKKGEGSGQAKILATPSKSTGHTSPSKPGAEPDRDDVFEGPSRGAVGKAVATSQNDVNLNPDTLKHVEMSLMMELTRILNDQFGNLYKRMAEDKRISDSAGAAKQDAVLRLLSQTLQENFDGHVSKIISDAIRADMKGVKESINGTVDRSITTTFSNSVKSTLPREVEKAVEVSLNKALSDGSFTRNMTDAVTKQLTPYLSKAVTTTFKEIVPILQTSIAASSQQTCRDIERRFHEQALVFEMQHKQDSEKIDNLTSQLQSLTAVLKTMAMQQEEFRAETRSLFNAREPARAPPPSYHGRGISGDLSRQAPPAASEKRATPQQLSSPVAPQDPEAEMITKFLRDGKYDEAFVQWLHSNRQGDLFDRIFVHLGPKTLDRATPLVVLSVTAAVSFSLESKLRDRLDWLEYALGLLEPNNPEYSSVLPKIMDVIINRLEQVLPTLSATTPHSIFARMAEVKNQAQLLKGLNSRGFHG